jgi:hypothetical protein
MMVFLCATGYDLKYILSKGLAKGKTKQAAPDDNAVLSLHKTQNLTAQIQTRIQNKRI